MAESKSTPRRIKHTPACRAPQERKDLAPWLQPLDDINDRIFDQLAALRCASKIIDTLADAGIDEELGAASNLLRRILRDLDGLHVRLDLLHGDLWFGREPRALAA